MPEEYWIRASPYKVGRRADNGIRILSNLHTSDFSSQGVSTQQDLTSEGALDLKMEAPDQVYQTWSFDEAVAYCCSELSKQNFHLDHECHSKFMVEMVRRWDGVVRFGICLAPTEPCRALVQEFVVPEDCWQPVLAYAASDPVAFVILREIGNQCIRYRNLDCQPQEFCSWFYSVIAEGVAPTAKMPQGLKTFSRNSLFYWLIREIERHGIQPTRNDASEPKSGCDAVATAVVKARISRPLSYGQIKNIYQEIKEQMAQ